MKAIRTSLKIKNGKVRRRPHAILDMRQYHYRDVLTSCPKCMSLIIVTSTKIFLAAEAYNFGSDTSKFDGISIRELTLILAYTSIDLSRTKLNETHKYV
jgi:hypothetical protein